jgi:hypothetical protein
LSSFNYLLSCLLLLLNNSVKQTISVIMLLSATILAS